MLRDMFVSPLIVMKEITTRLFFPQNLSRRALGRLVLEAVQDASGRSASIVRPATEDDVPPISLLTRLLSSLSHHASTKQQGENTEWLLHSALRGLAHPAEARERVEVTMG